MALSISKESITILIVIDTEYVKANYPRQARPNWKRPVPIDHNSQYMIAYDPRGINSGQATAELDFNAWLGDSVDFAGISIYQNSSDAVIIYGIEKCDGDNVFGQFVSIVVTRERAVTPDPDSPERNGLPPLQVSMNYSTLVGRVVGKGTENFLVQFGLYTLGTDGQTQDLYGYFTWDPTVRVP